LDFIPANESPLFIKSFRYYVWLLFKRRFTAVWLKQDYHPNNNAKTIYYLNHHSWWDGLIPLLLNEFRFRQQARALMEDEQMREHPFFSKIGAFSIKRSDKKSAIRSLRYAIRSFERPNASLFIYPEGRITPAGTAMDFEKGLAWLSRQLPAVDLVPVGIHMHTIRHDKPELHLHVGEPVLTKKGLSDSKQLRVFEQRLEEMLAGLRKYAGFDNTDFDKFI